MAVGLEIDEEKPGYKNIIIQPHIGDNLSYVKGEYTAVYGLIQSKWECEDTAIVRYFPYKGYYGAIIRRNGLPRRFFKGNDSEIFSNINEIMTIYGRDEMEALYIFPEELLFGKTFVKYL